MNDASLPTRVYHINPRRRWIPVWIFGPIILGIFLAWIFLPPAEKGLAGVLLLVILPFYLGMQWLIDRARLEVSPTGIRLRQTGYTLETPWTNVIELRMEHGREAFITKEKVGGKGQELLAATSSANTYVTPFYDDRHRELLDEHRLIPFEAFAWHLWKGDLRGDIEHQAPHLRSALDAIDLPEAKQPTAKTKMQPLDARAWMVIGCIMAFVCGLWWLSSRSEAHSRLIDAALGTLGITAFAINFLYVGRDFLRRKLWIFGSLTVLVGIGLALWGLAVGTDLIALLELSPRNKGILGMTIFGGLTLLTVRGTRNAFRRKSIIVGVLLVLLTLFLAMMTFGMYLDFAKAGTGG